MSGKEFDVLLELLVSDRVPSLNLVVVQTGDTEGGTGAIEGSAVLEDGEMRSECLNHREKMRMSVWRMMSLSIDELCTSLYEFPLV